MSPSNNLAAQGGGGPRDDGLHQNEEKEADARAPLSRILIVEDERIVALDLRRSLITLGYEVVASVSSGEAAIEEARTLRPNLILMDIRLAGVIDGIETAETITGESDVPIIFLTAHSDDPTLTRATKTGPYGFVVKPFKTTELHCAIEVALHRHEIEAKLKERERWLSSTLKSVGDGVIAVDTENKVQFLNRVAETLTGYASSEAVGRIFDDIMVLVSDKNRFTVASPMEGAVRDGTVQSLEKDASLLSKSGKAIPIDDTAAPILNESGDLLGGVMVFKDVTEHRRSEAETETKRAQAEFEIQKLNADLEARVVERTEQLEAANRELESFSYSVAHDLRAPLRGIEGFSAILIEEYTANLGPDAVDCLNRIRCGVKRMRHLIDDLLRLARVAHADRKQETVNLTEIVKSICAELRGVDPNRNVDLLVQEDVAVEGDRALLTIALDNLLGNAWKFSGEKPESKIEFGAYRKDDKQVCFVRDNGVGFDMKYADRLFGAFQRLPSTKDFDGTGIGLAIVERIIHRHAGRIWAESAPAEGTTFFFTV